MAVAVAVVVGVATAVAAVAVAVARKSASGSSKMSPKWGLKVTKNRSPMGPWRPPGGAASGRPLGAKADFGPILGPIWDPRLGSKIVPNRFDFKANFEHRCGTACVPLRRPPGVVLGPDLGASLDHFGVDFGLPTAYGDFCKK